MTFSESRLSESSALGLPFPRAIFPVFKKIPSTPNGGGHDRLPFPLGSFLHSLFSLYQPMLLFA